MAPGGSRSAGPSRMPATADPPTDRVRRTRRPAQRYSGAVPWGETQQVPPRHGGGRVGGASTGSREAPDSGRDVVVDDGNNDDDDDSDDDPMDEDDQDSLGQGDDMSEDMSDSADDFVPDEDDDEEASQRRTSRQQQHQKTRPRSNVSIGASHRAGAHRVTGNSSGEEFGGSDGDQHSFDDDDQGYALEPPSTAQPPLLENFDEDAALSAWQKAGQRLRNAQRKEGAADDAENVPEDVIK